MCVCVCVDFLVSSARSSLNILRHACESIHQKPHSTSVLGDRTKHACVCTCANPLIQIL